MAEIEKVVILGTGPAGLTAGLYTSRAQLEPLIVHGPQPGGQLTITTDVENYPGFPEGIQGPELMQNMQKQTERFGARFKQSKVISADISKTPFTLECEDGEKISCETLIISTGATARTLGLAQEAELMGFGLSTCATCDGAFFKDEEIVVVGGGDSACEEALFLSRFGTRVRMVLRRDEFRASKIMEKRVREHEKIELIFNHNVVELLGDKKSGLRGAVLEHSDSGERQEISCAGLFYAIGHTPNTELFAGQLEMDENGYLLTKPDSTKTQVEGVFACGDVQDHQWRQAVTAAGTGCMAAIEAERLIASRE